MAAQHNELTRIDGENIDGIAHRTSSNVICSTARNSLAGSFDWFHGRWLWSRWKHFHDAFAIPEYPHRWHVCVWHQLFEFILCLAHLPLTHFSALHANPLFFLSFAFSINMQASILMEKNYSPWRWSMARKKIKKDDIELLIEVDACYWVRAERIYGNRKSDQLVFPSSSSSIVANATSTE